MNCLDCNRELGINSKYNGATRCHSCDTKKRWKDNPELFNIPKGKDSYQWKGGVKNNKALSSKYAKERRHRLGINKRYKNDGIKRGKSYTVEYKRERRKLYNSLKKGGGSLSVVDIQLVYENNIKKFGTLTCYLCFNPIKFGDDHLEHKTPLSRGGTNSIENLDISHSLCNHKKYNKTESEYREEILHERPIST